MKTRLKILVSFIIIIMIGLLALIFREKMVPVVIPEIKQVDTVNIEVNYEKVRIKHILAKAKVKVSNYNDMKLTINKINYRFNVLNHGTMEGQYSEPIFIKPNSESVFDLPIEIKWEHFGKTAIDVLNDH